jgi:uncharacterized membrane protein YccC
VTDSRRDRLNAAVRLAAGVAVAAIVVLSVVPGTLRPHTTLAGRYEHLMAYAGAACLARLGFRVSMPAGTAFFVALAIAMEVAQLWVPGRVSAVTDAAAGSLGALAGLLAAGTLQRHVRILSP